MYQIKEEDARKVLASLRQIKCSVEENIMIFERLVMQSYVWDTELCGEDPDDYLSEWVAPRDDDEFEDSELYKMYTYPYETNASRKDHLYEYCDCDFYKECDSYELEDEEYYE